MDRLLICFILFLVCVSVSAQDTLSRHPTVDEVATYLRFHLDEPPSGFISYFWIDDEPLLYADLNGDAEDDLIARGWLFVAVMLWEEDAYGVPMQVIHTADTTSGAWSNVTLQDWTLDGVPDITFDQRTPLQGIGYQGNRYDRTIISCELLCYVAWEGQIANYVAVETEQGMYLSQSEMTVSENAEGRIVLDVTTEDFAFNCTHPLCLVTGEVIEQDRFQAQSRIGASTRTRYLWDGLEFLLSDKVTLIDAYNMPPQSQLSTDRAHITYEDTCQLWLDEYAIGEAFLCVVDFTRVYWHSDYLVLEYAFFTEEMMILYDSSGTEQFRVSGAIRDASLFGVRLDGQSLVSTGDRYTADCSLQACWFTLNQEIRIYPL